MNDDDFAPHECWSDLSPEMVIGALVHGFRGPISLIRVDLYLLSKSPPEKQLQRIEKIETPLQSMQRTIDMADEYLSTRKSQAEESERPMSSDDFDPREFGPDKPPAIVLHILLHKLRGIVPRIQTQRYLLSKSPPEKYPQRIEAIETLLQSMQHTIDLAGNYLSTRNNQAEE